MDMALGFLCHLSCFYVKILTISIFIALVVYVEGILMLPFVRRHFRAIQTCLQGLSLPCGHIKTWQLWRRKWVWQSMGNMVLDG